MNMDLSHGGILRIVGIVIGVSMSLYHMWAIALATAAMSLTCDASVLVMV